MDFEHTIKMIDSYISLIKSDPLVAKHDDPIKFYWCESTAGWARQRILAHVMSAGVFCRQFAEGFILSS